MDGLHHIAEALLLTLMAGLSTGIGGAVIFFSKALDARVLAVSLGLSAGVMIYVSLVELLPGASAALAGVYGAKDGGLTAMLSFFGGILLIAAIDKAIPCAENPHELACSVRNSPKASRTLRRTGLLTALAISVHNFPEGIAAFVAANQSLKLAIPVIFAIAVHNVPEGVAIAMPIYHATGSRRIALRWSLLAGLAEPLGALLAWAVLAPFLGEALFGVLYAAVAGIMVFISLDELLPSARAWGEHHLSMYGLVAGMAIMALSLWLFL